jgi:multidrug resistance efflux pump
MTAKVSSQSQSLANPPATDAMFRNDATDKTAENSSKPAAPLNASFTVSLSQTAQSAQSVLTSARMTVQSPDEARQQLSQIKDSLQQSPASVQNLQNFTPQSVIDLLA